MGWSYDTASWAVVEGASFPGAGTAMPGVWTAIAIAVCVVMLVIGNKAEHDRYKEHN